MKHVLVILALAALAGCGDLDTPPPADAYSEVDTVPPRCSVFVMTDRGLSITPQPVHVHYGTTPRVESDSDRYLVLDSSIPTREYGDADGWIAIWDRQTETAIRGSFSYKVGRCKL